MAVFDQLERMIACGRPNKALLAIMGPDEAHEFIQNLAALEDFSESSLGSLNRGLEVLTHLEIVAAEKAAAKIAQKELSFAAQTANRQLYLPSVSLVLAEKTGFRYHFGLESEGLVARIIGCEQGWLAHPTAVQIVNELVDEDGKKVPMSEEQIAALVSQGYRVSKEKVAWHWATVRGLFLQSFPKAVDFVAYNHRGRAPLVPGGFLPGQSVCFWAQTSASVTGDETPQGADGSGCWDPLHPAAADILARYGEVCIQVTILCRDTGLFAKGILAPRPGLSARLGVDTAWFPDHAQIKGSQKGTTADRSTAMVENAYIGVMKTWSRAATMAAGFEHLEHLGVTPHPDPVVHQQRRLRLAELIRRSIQRAADKLLKNGFEGIIEDLAEEDEGIAAIWALLKAFASQGTRINPLSVGAIEGAIRDRLQRKLWPIATGAGIEGLQLALVIDNNVPEGTVVTRSAKPGQECAAWRWPAILGCGNLVLMGCEPSASHLDSKGNIIANTAFMNPRDVLRMQADDDGDIIGLSTNPEVVEMWRFTLDRTDYAAEPTGEKFSTLTESVEGVAYGERDPRGPVGQTTIMCSRLRAAGDHDAGLALAVLNQEAIDMAKRFVRFTSWEKAADPRNWRVCVDGRKHIHWASNGSEFWPLNAVPSDAVVTETSDNYFAAHASSTFPLDELQMWVGLRMANRGVYGKKNQTSLGWREQKDAAGKPIKKRIDWTNWHKSVDLQGGATCRNVVHFSHDTARELIRERILALQDAYEETAPELNQLLPALMEKVAVDFKFKKLSYGDYKQDLRKRSGIEAYGKAMKAAMEIKDENERQGRVEAAFADLHIGLRSLPVEDLVAIWWREHTTAWGYKLTKNGQPFYVDNKALVPERVRDDAWVANKPNHAYRAVAHPGSKLLELFGTQVSLGCKFLTSPGKSGASRQEELLNWALHQPDSVSAVANFLVTNVSHAAEVSDQNGKPVQLHECSECRDRAQNLLVRHHRQMFKSGVSDALKSLVTNANLYVKEHYIRPENVLP